MTTTFTARTDFAAKLRLAAVPEDSAVIHIRDGYVVGAYAPDGPRQVRHETTAATIVEAALDDYATAHGHRPYGWDQIRTALDAFAPEKGEPDWTSTFLYMLHRQDGLWVRVALPTCPKESFIHQTACLTQEYL
mgnify:CR=1 FL=1